MLKNWSLTGVLLLSGLMAGEALAVAPPVETSLEQELELTPELRIAQSSLGREPLIFEGALNERSQVFEADGSYFNTHTFAGQAGEAVQIDLVSDEFNTHLILLDPDSNPITGDNDGGENQNARIVFALPLDGEYTILAGSYQAGEVGHYRMAVQRAVLDDGVITHLELPPELLDQSESSSK
ncbi:MAG: PPC domain-containing protein [Spirulinaceae cyanobacterium]